MIKIINLNFVILLTLSNVLFAQSVGINATGSLPDPSAALDISFTDKGFLIPRVNLNSVTDATTIPSPATSLLVYNTGLGGLSTPGFYYNNGTPSAPNWIKIASGTFSNSTPTFITPVNILANFTGNHGTTYQTANLSSYVPTGTKQIIVEVHWNMTSPDNGDVDAFLYVRKNASNPTYVIGRGRSAGSSDHMADAVHAIIPIDETNLTFQYLVDPPGFNSGLYFKLIGYY